MCATFAMLSWTALLAVMCSHLSLRTEAIVVASSSIEHCERGRNVDLLPCEKKMVVTLVVDGGQASGVEEVVLLREATDTTEADGKRLVEFEPIRLIVNKSRVDYAYPVTYRQEFNAKPYEEQIVTELLEGCDDAFLSSSSTCGSVLGADGVPIPYSQGFCCSCNACQLSGLCPPDSRGSHTCSLFGKTSTASCLRFGELWYSGYDVGSGSAQYRVSVTLMGGTDDADEGRESTLELGPDKILDSSIEFGAWARLVGDFVPPETPPVLTSKMLFVPSLPKTHERVVAGPKEWLLLDKHHVNSQGRECNKVGVSHEAFVSQGSRCHLRRGSCLEDQLEDYRARDLRAEARGRKGAYMARFLGDFSFAPKNSTLPPHLLYSMRGSLSTMVSVTISADRLRYLQSVSSGEIVMLAVVGSDPHGVSGTFMSASRDGVLTVTARNTGTVVAQYTLGVGNCTEHIFPVPAQPLSIRPEEAVTHRFNLNLKNMSAQGAVRCDVTLQDARGNVADKKSVEFRVTGVRRTNGTQLGHAPRGGGRGVVREDVLVCAQCEWHDPICFLKNRCSWQPLLYVLVLVGVLGSTRVVVKHLGDRDGARRGPPREAREPVAVPQVVAHGMPPFASVVCVPVRR